jgi:lipopolysaccharide transport system permease protein
MELTLVLTKKEIRIRYKNYLLGYVWSVANPLAFALVFYVAFHMIMKVPIENYALFLITGLFPWQWFSNSITVAPSTFLGNASLIKKIMFPRSVLVLAVVLHDGAHFVFSLPVTAFFILLYGGYPSPAWLWGVPLLLVIQLMMTFGLALFVATVNLFFRDIERLVSVFMTFIFYFTPVLYSEKMIPEQYLPLIKYHPFAPLMISWRQVLLEGSLNPSYLISSLLFACAALLLGYGVYRRFSWRFAEVL